ncbi:uncharacterized protein LOC111274388 [Durio zibethinus]|uniref:Uncharacterized protein LOC111274388 n=1 Tax=Durio zibethinus TaxID=66656 RepID=A0A6P5WFE5_DURZI|nr:uncharacterized protein LOC111274388 [Durio zibethinus]
MATRIKKGGTSIFDLSGTPNYHPDNRGLHTYIHPENVGHCNNASSGVRTAIRRLSGSDSGPGLDGYQSLSSRNNAELKKRSKSKDIFEFDENNAQIFGLKLDDGYQSLSSRNNAELKKRSKSKDMFEFDENNAQIFRLKLDEGPLQTRLFFNGYHNSFVFSFVGISCLLLWKYLGESKGSGVLANGNLIPVIFGFIGLTKVF